MKQMRKINRSGLLFLSVLFAQLISCTQDDPRPELILGKWTTIEASRNGSPTATLDGLFFEFLPEGAMKTNLSGATETGTYQLEEEQLLQRNTQMEVDYTITELTDSVLILTTTLRSFNFRFKMGKAPSTVGEEVLQ